MMGDLIARDDVRLALCTKLRTKTSFGCVDPRESDWRDGDSTTAVYWCLATLETAGPDNVLCHPSTCRAGRACFQAEPE